MGVVIADPTAPNGDLAGAVELAREAAQAEAGDSPVGEHVGVQNEDGGAATHLFAAGLPGYRGWCWAVTVASALASVTRLIRTASWCETCLRNSARSSSSRKPFASSTTVIRSGSSFL